MAKLKRCEHGRQRRHPTTQRAELKMDHFFILPQGDLVVFSVFLSKE